MMVETLCLGKICPLERIRIPHFARFCNIDKKTNMQCIKISIGNIHDLFKVKPVTLN